MSPAAILPASRSPRSARGARLLQALSRNLRWSWDAEATALWDDVARALGTPPARWSPRNPVRLLSEAEPEALSCLLADPRLLERVERVHCRLLEARPPSRPRDLRLPGPVGYFSMEFGAHESLPIYAGGLGILAGDHAKTASDLGVPLIGVGLFYREGYFRQEADGRGRQKVLFPRVDPRLLPLERWRDARGRELVVKVELPGREVGLAAWRVRLGGTDLVLLDSDLPGNSPADRALTHRLYIGDRQLRISQEVLCGIGGVRALTALGLEPAVWHLNEGHVAFLTLERMRALTAPPANGTRRAPLPFPDAVEAVAADTVFTTHTPVPEGNEVFALDLARRYLERPCRRAGIAVEDYLSLGLDRRHDGMPAFSMTVLALRLSRFRNGVSRLHGQVSRKMWRGLWPGFASEEAPITSVTNGVHVPTWIAPEMASLYQDRLGRDWAARLDDPPFWRKATALPDADLWAAKRVLKGKLIAYVRERMEAQMIAAGESPGRARREASGLLRPDALTIGFSRRFALYKRAGLLFRDAAKARELLGDDRRPLQLVFAGKPHPEDRLGADLFNQIAAISRRPEFVGKVVLLAGYDIEMARVLVQGADVWLNTPRRPLEASGTSGQKVIFNGGLNLSVLDGWWDEAYSPGVGWAMGSLATTPTSPRRTGRTGSPSTASSAGRSCRSTSSASGMACRAAGCGW